MRQLKTQAVDRFDYRQIESQTEDRIRDGLIPPKRQLLQSGAAVSLGSEMSILVDCLTRCEYSGPTHRGDRMKVTPC